MSLVLHFNVPAQIIKKKMLSFRSIFLSFIFSSNVFHYSFAGLLAKRVDGTTTNTVPAVPVQTQTQTCRLDLSKELFGGVSQACSRNLDRSRRCPVLAAWLFAAHARSALEVTAQAPSAEVDQPIMPYDSQKCVNSLQSSLMSRNVRLPQPNTSCDPILCFCGIRFHQIGSLSCPAAFDVSGFHNATPSAAVRNLERNCRNSSYEGCSKCLGALQKLKGTYSCTSDRATKIFNRDCQLMGLTWLLTRNKTIYIPTVSAVLGAIMYSVHPPQESTCSPDQENMPLAVDSLQFENAQSSSPPSISLFTILPLQIILMYLCFVHRGF